MTKTRSTFRTAAPLAIGSVLLAAGSSAAMDDCTGPNATCWGCFSQSIADCNFVFPDPADAPLRDACALGAGAAYLACTTSSNQSGINDAWNELLEDLQECEQMFTDPVLLQGCIDVMYERFKDALEAATGNTYEDPTILNLVTGMPVNTLNDIATSSELNRSSTNYVTTEVGQNVSLPNAGVGPGYDAALIPDVESVILMATYRTKLGTVTRIVDQDMDVSDGSPLSMHLNPTDLVHADQIVLSAVYMSHDAVPVFFETGVVLIPDSPISGDYNRDATTDSLDMIEYVDGYGNAVRRADMNENGDIEVNDLGEFVDDYTSGD